MDSRNPSERQQAIDAWKALPPAQRGEVTGLLLRTLGDLQDRDEKCSSQADRVSQGADFGSKTVIDWCEKQAHEALTSAAAAHFAALRVLHLLVENPEES